MKTIKKVKIVTAVVCAIVAIALCIAVCKEWKAQGCETASLVVGCIFYCIGCFGIYIGATEFADWINYWFFNGDEYYKGRKH